MGEAIAHEHVPYIDLALRWTARVVGSFTVALFTIFVAGEGLHPSLLTRTEMVIFVALFVTLAGLVVAWNHEGLGGAMSVSGLIAFYLLNFAASGRWPRGVIIPMMFIPGLLFLASWWRSGRV